MANDFFAYAQQRTAEKNQERRKTTVDKYFEKNPQKATAKASGFKPKKSPLAESYTPADNTGNATDGPATAFKPQTIETPELDAAVGNMPTADTSKFDDLLKEYRLAKSEADLTAQSGGMVSAEQAARLQDLEKQLRENDISQLDRFENIVTGAGKRFGSGYTNTFATSIDALAQIESTREAYDPLYNPLVQALNGGNREQYIEEFRQAAHEQAKPVYEAADRLGKSAAADLEKAKTGLGELGQAGVDIAENMLEMGFDLAAGAITGGGSLGSMFIRVLGNQMQEARQNGATLNQQMASGITTAGIEILTEKLFDGVARIYGAGAADKITENLVGKLAKTDTGRSAARLLLGAIGEGNEELISDLLSPLSEAMYKTDENGNRLTLSQLYGERFSDEGRAEMLYDFLIGAAVSAIAGGANILTGQDARANQALREQEAPTSEFNSAGATESTNPAEVMAQMAQGQTEAETPTQPAPQTEEVTPIAETLMQGEQAQAAEEQGDTPVPPAGTVRSQSEANTIQALDEQLGAPEEVRNPLYYNPVSEEQSVSAARDFLENGYESNGPARASADLTPEQSASLTQAGERLGGGYAQAIADLQGPGNWSGVQMDMSTLLLEALADDAAKTGNWSAYEAWRMVDQAHGTEAARALQARGKRTSATDIINKTIDQVDKLGITGDAKTKVLDEALPFAKEVADAINGANRNPDLAGEASQKLRDIITQISQQRHTGTIIPGMLGKLLSKQTDLGYLSNLAEASVRGLAADAVPTDAGQKLKTWQSIAMLLKITTTLRNLGGNSTFGVLDTLVGDVFGVALDKAISGKTGKRAVDFDTRWLNKTQQKGARDAFNKAVLEIALDADMGSVGTKYIPTTRANNPAGGPISKALSRAEQILGYTLNASDRLYRGGIESGAQESLSRLNPEASQEEINEAARERASYRLFQNKGMASTAARGVHDFLNLAGVGGEVQGARRVGGFGLGDIVTPFASVPANLGVKAFEYSPAGMAKGLYDLAKVMKDAKTGSSTIAQQQKAVMEIARGVTGVPIAMAFAAAIKAGLIKRADDDDDYKVTKARQSENRKETQWNLDATMRALRGEDPTWREDDKLVSLSWLEPLNAFMDIGAMFAEIPEEDDPGFWDRLKYYGGEGTKAYIAGAFDAFMEIPMMDNLQSAMQTIQYMDEGNIIDKAVGAAEDLAKSGVTGMMPGLLSQVGRAMDPVQRDTSADTFTQEMANAIMNALPVARENLPAKLDSFGNPIQEENPLLNVLNSTVLPGTVTEYKPSEVVQALDEVYEATGKSNFYPDYKAPDKFSFDDVDYELNTAEKRTYQETYGQKYAELISATENNKQFEDMDPATKAKVYSEIRSMATAEAKGKIVSDRGGEYKSDYDSVLALSDIPSYLATKDIFKDAADSKGGRNYEAIDGLLKNYDNLPDDVKKKLDSGNTGDLDRLHAAWSAGVKTENWFKAYDATKALKPVEGKESVADWQRYEAIANVSYGVDADKILKGYMSESTYNRYMAARHSGVMATTWCKANAGISQIKPAEGYKDRAEWQEYEYIVQNYPRQTKAILLSFIDSDSMRTRLNTAADYGFSAEQWVAYYKQNQLTNGKNDKGDTVSGLKKKRMQEWALSYGFTRKQFEYLYRLTNAQTKDLANFNSKFK